MTSDTALTPQWKLHRRILLVLGVLAGTIVVVSIASLVTGAAKPGLDRLAAFALAIVFSMGFGVHAALSTVLAAFANTRRGVVLAHVASPVIIAAFLWAR